MDSEFSLVRNRNGLEKVVEAVIDVERGVLV